MTYCTEAMLKFKVTQSAPQDSRAAVYHIIRKVEKDHTGVMRTDQRSHIPYFTCDTYTSTQLHQRAHYLASARHSSLSALPLQNCSCQSHTVASGLLAPALPSLLSRISGCISPQSNQAFWWYSTWLPSKKLLTSECSSI